MKDFTQVALETARKEGASFADIRLIEERQNRIVVERKSLKWVDETDSFGYGIRVLVNGSWGFASNTNLTKEEVVKTTLLALESAKASGVVPKQEMTQFSSHPSMIDECFGPCQEDPFDISNKEKTNLLVDVCKQMMEAPHIASVFGYFQFIKRRRVIANTDDSYLDMTNTFTNPHLQATAVVNNDSESRSYQGGAKQAGFEFIRELQLEKLGEKLAKEAVIKCQAEKSPSGMMDLVLDPDHLALTMHESVGHPTELDRILGWEANMAGRSFITPEDINNLRYGSNLVNFTADGNLEGGLASWFYDDDGVKMQKFKIIDKGKLTNVGMTRETAPIIGFEHSNGCCRADSFQRFPINRIPNLYMEPGDDPNITPDTLIEGVQRGIYIEGRGSFSIDQMRNNFQFGGDFFWLIENGKKVKPLKQVTYQSQTKQFWNSCDGIANRSFWRPHGLMNCGKGEPVQVNIMTHGASHCRFRNINVGGAEK